MSFENESSRKGQDANGRTTADRSAAASKHGLASVFARTGDETALQPVQRARLAELREELSTPQGVRDALIERAARMVLVCEWGESWLRQKAEKDGPEAAFTAPMLARFFTAAAEARRALESLSKIHGPGDGAGADAARVLESLKHEQA